MYSPIHASTGLMLATVMPDPATAFLAGVASHYLFDAIPHGDMEVGPWMISKDPFKRLLLVEIFDLGIAAAMVIFLVGRYPALPLSTLLAGAIGAILPDLAWGGEFVLRKFKLLPDWLRTILDLHGRWHTWIHAKHHYDMPFLAGLAYQVALVLIVWLIYL